MTKNSIFNTNLSLYGDFMLIGNDDECLKEHLTKRLKINDVVFDINVTPLLYV